MTGTLCRVGGLVDTDNLPSSISGVTSSSSSAPKIRLLLPLRLACGGGEGECEGGARLGRLRRAREDVCGGSSSMPLSGALACCSSSSSSSSGEERVQIAGEVERVPS